MILLPLLLSLLHLFALVLVVRLTLPKHYIFANPYSAAINGLAEKALTTLRSAIPLPSKPLSLLLLALILASRAALSTQLGAPSITLSAFAIAKYNVTHFFGWFGVEVLRFVGFYITVLSCGYVLRLWHFGRGLPGYSGDMLTTAGRPFAFLPLLGQTFVLFCLISLYVWIVLATATSFTYPPAEAPELKQMFAQTQLKNILNFGELPFALHFFLLVSTTFLEIISAIHGSIFILILMLLVAMLTRAGPMAFFLMDMKRLICGPIRPIYLGPFDLSLPLLYITLLLIYITLTSFLLIFALVVSHVV